MTPPSFLFLVGFPIYIQHKVTKIGFQLETTDLGPSLQSVLFKLKEAGKQLDRTTCFSVVIQLIERMRVLHELNFLYGDLELSNLTFDEEKMVLGISDFSKVQRYL